MRSELDVATRSAFRAAGLLIVQLVRGKYRRRDTVRAVELLDEAGRHLRNLIEGRSQRKGSEGD